MKKAALQELTQTHTRGVKFIVRVGLVSRAYGKAPGRRKFVCINAGVVLQVKILPFCTKWV